MFHLALKVIWNIFLLSILINTILKWSAIKEFYVECFDEQKLTCDYIDIGFKIYHFVFEVFTNSITRVFDIAEFFVFLGTNEAKWLRDQILHLLHLQGAI